MGWQVVSDRAPGDHDWIARSQRAGGAAAGRIAGGAPWRTVFAGERVRSAQTSRKRAATGKPAKTRRAGRRGSDWNKNFDLKKAPKIWQAAQASGHKREKPSDGLSRHGNPEEWREGKVRPVPGNSPHDRLVRRGYFFIVPGEFATIPSPPLRSACTAILRPSVCVFQAWRNLSVRWGWQSQTKPWGGTDRLPPVGPEPR